MESDREVLLAMLRRANVNFNIDERGGSLNVDVDDQPDEVRKGYSGFGSAFYFNADGSLQTIGAWE